MCSPRFYFKAALVSVWRSLRRALRAYLCRQGVAASRTHGGVPKHSLWRRWGLLATVASWLRQQRSRRRKDFGVALGRWRLAETPGGVPGGVGVLPHYVTLLREYLRYSLSRYTPCGRTPTPGESLRDSLRNYYVIPWGKRSFPRIRTVASLTPSGRTFGTSLSRSLGSLTEIILSQSRRDCVELSCSGFAKQIPKASFGSLRNNSSNYSSSKSSFAGFIINSHIKLRLIENL